MQRHKKAHPIPRAFIYKGYDMHIVLYQGYL